MTRPTIWPIALLMLTLPAAGCSKAPPAATQLADAPSGLKQTVVSVKSANGVHRFTVEIAATAQAQERGLMFRTDIPADHGMLFSPYPPDGGPPREASFWMKNTPSALDILFIRADGTVARIAENAVPFDITPIPSIEPVAAVLEINGGRSAELGIAEGDRVSWK